MVVKVPHPGDMDDETFIKHMERRHSEHMKLKMVPEPDGGRVKLIARPTWDVFHRALHRFKMFSGDHSHRSRHGR